MMKTEEQAAMIYYAISECFNDESDLPMHMKASDITEKTFDAGVLALKLLYEKITGGNPDVLDFIGILNKVCVQGIMDQEKENAQAQKESEPPKERNFNAES